MIQHGHIGNNCYYGRINEKFSGKNLVEGIVSDCEKYRIRDIKNPDRQPSHNAKPTKRIYRVKKTSPFHASTDNDDSD